LTLQNKVDELRPVGRRLEGVKDIEHVSPEFIERCVIDDGSYFVNVDFFPFVDLEVLSLLIYRQSKLIGNMRLELAFPDTSSTIFA